MQSDHINAQGALRLDLACVRSIINAHFRRVPSNDPVTIAERAACDRVLAIAAASEPEREPDAWLAEVRFKGSWGASRLFRDREEAEAYTRKIYDPDHHETRVVPLYRAARTSEP